MVNIDLCSALGCTSYLTSFVSSAISMPSAATSISVVISSGPGDCSSEPPLSRRVYFLIRDW